jgi:hypothetical protein
MTKISQPNLAENGQRYPPWQRLDAERTLAGISIPCTANRETFFPRRNKVALQTSWSVTAVEQTFLSAPSNTANRADRNVYPTERGLACFPSRSEKCGIESNSAGSGDGFIPTVTPGRYFRSTPPVGGGLEVPAYSSVPQSCILEGDRNGHLGFWADWPTTVGIVRWPSVPVCVSWW